LTTANLIAARVVEQLGRSDPKDLSTADALRLAQARYEKAATDYKLKMMVADSLDKTRLVNESQGKLSDLARKVQSAETAVKVEAANKELGKLKEAVDAQKSKVAATEKANETAKSLLDDIESRLSANATKLDEAKTKGDRDAQLKAVAERVALMRWLVNSDVGEIV